MNDDPFTLAVEEPRTNMTSVHSFEEAQSALHILMVGFWLGGYLFTTLVVSPTFRQLFPDEAVRRAHRRALGRQYARVNGPLTVLIILSAFTLGVIREFPSIVVAELVLWLTISVLIALHVRADGQNARRGWLGAAIHVTAVLLGGSTLLRAA